MTKCQTCYVHSSRMLANPLDVPSFPIYYTVNRSSRYMVHPFSMLCVSHHLPLVKCGVARVLTLTNSPTRTSRESESLMDIGLPSEHTLRTRPILSDRAAHHNTR